MGDLGGRLRELRTARGLTMNALARALNCSQGYLSGLESGKKTPSVTFLSEMCRHLEGNEHWLLTGEGPRDVKTIHIQFDDEYPEVDDGDDDQVIGPGRKHLVAPDDPKLAELVWSIAEWWAGARTEDRTWFEVQFKREFPEVAAKGKKSV